MKTHLGKALPLALVAATISPHLAAANDPAAMRGSHEVSHLTLLSGPGRTSPPRGAVPVGPTMRLPAATEPAVKVGSAAGTLSLSPENPNKVAAPGPRTRLPSPESLRFESTLHAPQPATGSGWKFTPGPKRD